MNLPVAMLQNLRVTSVSPSVDTYVTHWMKAMQAQNHGDALAPGIAAPRHCMITIIVGHRGTLLYDAGAL